MFLQEDLKGTSEGKNLDADYMLCTTHNIFKEMVTRRTMYYAAWAVLEKLKLKEIK